MVMFIYVPLRQVALNPTTLIISRVIHVLRDARLAAQKAFCIIRINVTLLDHVCYLLLYSLMDTATDIRIPPPCADARHQYGDAQYV